MDQLWRIHLLERAGGPLTFRIFVQPAVAIALAMRAGTGGVGGEA